MTDDDLFLPATRELIVATRAKDRWFDLDAVRTPGSDNSHPRIAKGGAPRTDLPHQQRDGNWNTLPAVYDQNQNPAGAPPLDWWRITDDNDPPNTGDDNMGTARFIVGDTRAVTRRLIADGVKVDLVMTSPPFLALRSYLPDDHPDKGLEIGSEATPAAFIDMLLELTALWGDLLAPHGSLCVELGDTFSGSGGGGGDYNADGLRAGQPKFRQMSSREHRPEGAAHRSVNDFAPALVPATGGDGWPLAKCLAMIPELYRVALAYGINPLTGAPSPAGRWRVRNVVRWVRPNPPVGALGDKFRPATSDMVVACRAKDRWFDLDAVRTTPSTDLPPAKGNNTKGSDDSSFRFAERINSNPAGAPPLDWWEITPGGYSGAHYGVFPPELCVRPVKAMCPLEVCTACGTPRRRIVEQTEEYAAFRLQQNAKGKEAAGSRAHAARGRDGGEVADDTFSGWNNLDDSAARGAKTTTLGWTDCGCGAPWRPGLTFDPFGGSGTVGVVATGHGRDAILVDLDERNADLARERIGMFLAVDDWRTPTEEDERIAHRAAAAAERARQDAEAAEWAAAETGDTPEEAAAVLAAGYRIDERGEWAS